MTHVSWCILYHEVIAKTQPFSVQVQWHKRTFMHFIFMLSVSVYSLFQCVQLKSKTVLQLNFSSSLTAKCQEGGSVRSSLSGLVLFLLHGKQRPGRGKHGQELPGGKHGLLSTLPLSGIPPLLTGQTRWQLCSNTHAKTNNTEIISLWIK